MQTEIPVPEQRPSSGPCAWCGARAVGTVVVEPAMWGKAANGARVMKRHAIEVPACSDHIRILDRQ